MDYEHEEFVDDDLYYDSYEEDEDYAEDDLAEYEGERREDEPAANIRPVEWTTIKISDTVLAISNRGVIRKNGDDIFCATRGFPILGSPYRMYGVGGRLYYVHDLVWRAFKGEPPTGWEVQHKITQKRRYYDNSLHHLTIRPILVEVHPRILPTSS
jgi:hypothetical protein